MTELEVGSTYITIDNDEIYVFTISKIDSNTSFIHILIKLSHVFNYIGNTYEVNLRGYIIVGCQPFPHPIPSTIEEL